MDLKPQWEESKSRRTQDEALEDISNTYAEMVQMRARKYNRSYTMLQQQLHSDIIQFEFHSICLQIFVSVSLFFKKVISIFPWSS